MNEIVSYCGLVCSSCPAFLATQEGSETKARETAELWSRLYGVKVATSDVWCDGCTVPGRKCAHCGECKIRACAILRGVSSCALCPEYECKEITDFLTYAPEARNTLERIKASSRR